MAIDSAEKRRSATGVPFIPLGPNVTPNAAKDTDWRQQVAWSYSGVPVSGEVVDVDDGALPIFIRRRRIRQYD